MFLAGLFTPAADGSQEHMSPTRAGRLQDLPLVLMAPNLPQSPDRPLVTFLTNEQQEAWIEAAAKVLRRPRLGQCGPLTAGRRRAIWTAAFQHLTARG